VLRNQVEPYEVCEALPTKTIVYTDLVNFSKFSNGTDIMEVYKFINTMYKAFDKIIPQFAGELVKRTGDGIIVRHSPPIFYFPLPLFFPSSLCVVEPYMFISTR
jgi:class 3 adenylate cyclase